MVTRKAAPLGELHQLSVEIGGIKAELRHLRQLIEQTRDQSTEEHRKVHDIVAATSDAMRTLARTVAEMKPLTDDYREKRAEARGAARLVRVFNAAAGGAVALILEQVVKLFAH